MFYTRKNEISSLDSLRAFAALAVCLFHFVCKTIDFIPENGVYDFFFSGQYGVHLFFVISGFVIPWAMYHGGYKMKSFFRFLLKRFARLEPPYLVSVVLALIVIYARAHIKGGGELHIEVSLSQILLHIGYLIPFFDHAYDWLTIIYWTLAVEFQYYFLIAFLYLPLMRFGLVMRLTIYALGVFFSFYTDSAFMPHWSPIFLLGVVLFLYKVEKITKLEYGLVSAALIVFCIILYPLPALFFILLPVVMVLFAPQKRIQGLHFLGKMSYSIYLIHSIIGIAVMNVLSHYVSGTAQKIGLVLLAIAVSLGASYIFYLLVERPSKRLSARIKYNKKEEAAR